MVRLYRSPSPAGKRRFIENQSDISSTRSPICGAGVLGKITRGKPGSSSSNSNSYINQTSIDNPNRSSAGQPRIDLASVNQHKKNLFGSTGISYESIGDSPTSFSAGRKSPESTESSTSGSSSRGEDDGFGESQNEESTTAGYVLQFHPESGEGCGEDSSTTEGPNSDRQQLRMDRLQAWMEQQKAIEIEQSQQGAENGNSASQQSQGLSMRSRASFWSTNLPVVKEERSFEGEDSSIASGGQSLKEEAEPISNIRSYSSPERNEMLLAMRQLVLKQQTALSEMAGENRQYRRELQECRKLLQLAKEAYTRQQRQLQSFMVEKESTEAEVLWLREEVKTLRTEIHQEEEFKTTWATSRSTDEVEERLRKVRAETPERRKTTVLEEATPAPSPVESPLPSPVTSPTRSWKLKSMLPNMNYLSDEAESDDEAPPREVKNLRNTLDMEARTLNRVSSRERNRVEEDEPVLAESRDDGTLSPKMWQEDEEASAPEDEMREWSRSPSPNRINPRRQQQQDTRGRSHQPMNLAVPREPSRTPSEISTNSSFSVASSVASQRSREEVALFKNRLEAIQKKREFRKHIEENVGSRSGRVRFT